MDNEVSEVPGSGVGDFMTPSRKKVIKSFFLKRASLRVTETWVFGVCQSWQAQCARSGALEQCSALAKERENEGVVEGGCVAGHGR